MSENAIAEFADRVVRIINGHRQTKPHQRHAAYDECISIIRREVRRCAPDLSEAKIDPRVDCPWKCEDGDGSCLCTQETRDE